MNCKELLALGCFENTEVITVCPLAQKIKNVTFIDAPDGDKWLSSGDFVLTTGFFVNSNQMQSWESDLLAFIKVLIERKCFGLGIKIGRHIPYIPSELIEYCNKKGFLIISLNNEYPWTEYLGEITNTINKFRNQEIEALNNVYNKFHTYLKERKKIDSLAEILYKIIGIPLTIYLKGLNIRIDYPEKFEHDLELDYLITTVFSGIGNEIEEVRYKNINFTIKWINEKNTLEGGIFIWGLLNEESAEAPVAIEHAALIANLHVEQQNIIKSIEQRQMNEFLLDLINDNYQTKELLNKKLIDLDITLHDQYILALVQIQPINNAITLPSYHEILSFFNWSNLCKENNILTGLDLNSKIIILLPINNYRSLLDHLVYDISKHFPKIRFSVGVSRKYNFNSLKECYREARIALNTIVKQSANVQDSRLIIVEFSNLYLERVLYSENSDLEMRYIYMETLDPIIQYDKKNKSNFLDTLEHFIKSNMNIEVTAQQLYLHKNTIRYRMKLISELMNIDFNNLNTIMLLKIAFNYLHLMKE
ncbi:MULTISPECIES: PucR family transcriptional regulator [Lysinibacillus]|uniref:PucR family transcriptional regulator n=1 Tax=Lysinibacillus TaxID=400634 RepID=UPI0018CE78CA|nr:PucR family transcriptional regulator [Lysinibacillus sphaericus]MBG9755849.1 hypothetical protein [Lysinibacillus sphaericus]MEB7452507.1 PucR family transcriptional regulator ligand-binding domain-containing protein [Lysinibacillus sphaericus]QTB14781.1 PucR family transcriptional regulator ligand-binding domain-containing protein [Lysinibacillus sphaericus]QTB28244.1 PucR family transcriptional regulator ligand-binding domain-containing protein [Lysinibacillus sphaericus]